MEIVILPSPIEVGAYAAAVVAHRLQQAADSPVLGVATGSSPLALYVELARLIRAGRLDLSPVTAFALDEYVGLSPGHPESYASVVARTVTEPLGLDPARVHVPDGYADNIPGAAAAYEQAIAQAGGVDVQILGLGNNGHIGFNEPGSSLSSRTRIKTLTRSTREANARFFDSLEAVPTHCLTQGLGTILDAHTVVLVAQGEAKAEAVAQLAEGPVTALCPASVLQLHERAIIVIDEAAASRLSRADYYREVFAGKPDWQRPAPELFLPPDAAAQ